MNHEVDVCYLDAKGTFLSRKFMRYETIIEADRIYKSTIAKFIKENTSAIISLRSMNGINWSMIKNERL